MKTLSSGMRPLLVLARDNEERMSMLVLSLYRCAVGTIADKLRPESFRQGELVLSADDERWLSIGEEKSEKLRQSLNGLFKRELVRRIVFRRKRGSLGRSRKAGLSRVKTVSRDLEEAAAEIRDPRTRKAFLEFASRLTDLRERKKALRIGPIS